MGKLEYDSIASDHVVPGRRAEAEQRLLQAGATRHRPRGNGRKPAPPHRVLPTHRGQAEQTRVQCECTERDCRISQAF